MTWFYARWGGIVLVACILAMLTAKQYQQKLVSVTPEAVLTGSHTQSAIRVHGMVKSGSLTGNPEEGHAEFALVGETGEMPVHYDGPPPDNLRELKTLILVGRWDPEIHRFHAHETALVTNYGFVTSAYVVAFVGLIVLLFTMSRNVALLFQEIKESKLYEPEITPDVNQR